jgi:hypothetical protein
MGLKTGGNVPLLPQREPRQQRSEFALARHAGFREDVLQRGAGRLLGDAEPPGRFARRQSRADQCCYARFGLGKANVGPQESVGGNRALVKIGDEKYRARMHEGVSKDIGYRNGIDEERTSA